MKTIEKISGYSIYKEFKKNPQSVFKSLSSIADIVKLSFGFSSIYILNAPRFVKHVQVNGFKTYIYDRWSTRFVKKLAGMSLIGLEGEPWKKRHKIMRPSFTKASLSKKYKLISSSIDKSFQSSFWKEALRNNEFNNINHLICCSSLSAIGNVLFSTHLTPKLQYNSENIIERHSYQLETLTHIIAEKIFDVLLVPLWMPTKSNRIIKEIKNTQYDLCREILNERKKMDTRPDDLLTDLLTQAEQSDELTEDILIQEMASLYFAGPTGLNFVTSWLFYHLGKDKKIYKHLQQEIDHVLKGKSPLLEDFYKMPYLMGCIKEANRLYPPGWIITRQTLQDIKFENVSIPKKSIIYVVPASLHTDKNYWKNPEKFDPERFTKDTTPYSYFPFGIGNKKCIGDNMSMIIMPYLICKMMQQFDFEIKEGYKPPVIAKHALKFKGGFPFKISKRKVTSANRTNKEIFKKTPIQ